MTGIPITRRKTRARALRPQPRLAALLFLPALLALNTTALAQDKDATALLELGGSGEWGLQDGSSRFGPSVAVEFTPIEHWLEIEAGVSRLHGAGQTEWETDLIFKKPFELSETVEFMVGAGPVWMHTTDGGETRNSTGGEAVLDVMVWPGHQRQWGWFVEPAYSYSFSAGHEQAASLSTGLLVVIP